jgi:neutral peptidase B
VNPYVVHGPAALTKAKQGYCYLQIEPVATIVGNRPVHNLLTMTKNGARVFRVEDVAVLTYLGMARLAPLATLAQALQAVVGVGQTYFGGDTGKAEKIAAIRKAYQLVGIA